MNLIPGGGAIQNLSDITLVMPTYNRPQYALRGMMYWGKLGVNVLVFDGSKEPLPLYALEKIPVSIKYFHRPVGFYSRLQAALNYIDTPYASLVADDEFFLKSGLSAAIDYLDKNPDYVACGGQAVGFWRAQEDIFVTKQYSGNSGFDLNHEDRAQRIKNHFSKYTPASVYATVRSTDFIAAITAMTAHEFSVYSIGELQLEMFYAWRGKVKVLDHIYWLRSEENKPTRNTDPSLYPERRLEKWWLNCDNQADKKKFIEIMSRHMAVSGLERSKTETAISVAMDAYVKFAIDYYSPRSMFSKIANSVSYKLRAALGLGDHSMSAVQMMKILDQYPAAVSDAAHDDLSNIYRMLCAWYGSSNHKVSNRFE
ncbi:hypothetical protein PuT2_14935 [Pusillimonas sp. T2]|uniref:TIGR00180 family glycosyltransferase n=1 Tax=Pusillimonas sp. T2 TaxID=1548123 RepID=UPI000B9C99D0|nr:TIGR00180 family glycosyltransferase [Pusillimonas sp. T2]OXR47990.1 hypothetical protein PuT2_14935 [Pusillimonas sp. T2]